MDEDMFEDGDGLETASLGEFIPPSINETALLAGDSYTYFSPVPPCLFASPDGAADGTCANSQTAPASSALHASPATSQLPPSSAPTSHLQASVPCVLGVDEAGRGPVLGPMVYGVFYAPAAEAEALLRGKAEVDDAADAGLRFDDSKVLSAATRAMLMQALCRSGSALHRRCGWAVSALSARDISAGMMAPLSGAAGGAASGGNLNAQALRATIDLIRGVLQRGVRVSDVFVDTVGPPATHQKKLEHAFPGLRITVAKKADSLYPSVSAASVCAKVTRDVALEVLYRRHAAAAAASAGLSGDHSADPAWGSGYPSDARCTAWLRRNMHPVFGWGPECRFSWGTAKDMLGEEDGAKRGSSSTAPRAGVTVQWPAPSDADDNSSSRRMTEFFVADAGHGATPSSTSDKINELSSWFGQPVGLEAF